MLASIIAVGQDIQVNRQNKTISITADESATADAEVAVLAIGYHNYAPTQDAAFRDNVRVAEQVVNALVKAGASSASIETDKLRLGLTELQEKWSDEMKKDRRFEAQQSWHVTVEVAQAQGVVELAVRAGANEVDDVDWNVIDPVALQAKASGAALAKARSIAEQMAKGLGTKLGELVYASNHAPAGKMFRGMQTVMVNAETSTVGTNEPKLKLFPEKVKKDATVYAVFAIE
jgi:hypothetical protein